MDVNNIFLVFSPTIYHSKHNIYKNLQMTLFIATLIVGLALIAKGIFWLKRPTTVRSMYKKVIRSYKAGYIIFGVAGIWFLWHIIRLGEADFGQYKHWLFILFAAVMIGAFKYLKDFLFVRGWAILILLFAQVFLDAAYMQEPASRLFLVSFIYLMIFVALYFGTLPYKARDLIEWIFKSPSRIKAFALSYLTYGIVLTTVAFFY